MLDALKQDADILFFNVFGIATITADQITVSTSAFRAGRLQGRIVTEELKNPLTNLEKQLIVSFGAWVDGNDVHLAVGKMDEYEEEIYRINAIVIDAVIKKALSLIKGALS